MPEDICPKCGNTDIGYNDKTGEYYCRGGCDWRTLTEGWVWFFNSRKAHYVKGHRALCGRWLYLGSGYEQGNDDSVDNCAECKRRLFKMRQIQHNQEVREQEAKSASEEMKFVGH